MLSDFLAAHDYDDADDGNNENDEPDRYLGKADINLTQRFL
jgi:hypothetical protein